MKRANISGCELTLFGYTLEIVTINAVPCCIALWQGSKIIGRLEVTP